MARPALATVEDLERLLGEAVSDAAQADARLEQASELVRAYARVDWLNDDESEIEDVPGQIPGVVAAIVERASRNPSGATQETAGPFSRSFGAEAAARMYLTAGEKLIIGHATSTIGLGVITTTRGPMETASVRECWDGGMSGLTEADDPYALWP